MYRTISNNVRTAWQSIREQSNSGDDESLDSAERGEVNRPDEKTPLLLAQTTSSTETPRTSCWSIRFPQINFFKMLWAAVLAPVYSVLIFLPMLPFWTFAGFLVYLLGTAPTSHFYLYVGCLIVLIPFNIVGTTFMVRRVWMDLYGE